MIRNKRRAILLVGRLRQNMCLNPLVLQWAERELGWSASESKWFATSVTSARDVLGIIAGSVLSVGRANADARPICPQDTAALFRG
jgi:hypothetical protein